MWSETKHFASLVAKFIREKNLMSTAISTLFWSIITLYYTIYISINNWEGSLDEITFLSGGGNFALVFLYCIPSIFAAGFFTLLFSYLYTRLRASRIFVCIVGIFSVFLFIMLTILTKDSFRYEYIFRSNGSNTGYIDLNKIFIIVYSISYFVSAILAMVLFLTAKFLKVTISCLGRRM